MGQCCFRSKVSIETEKSIPVSVATTTTPKKSTIETFRKSKGTIHPLYQFESNRSAVNQLDGWIRRMQSVKDDDEKCAIN